MTDLDTATQADPLRILLVEDDYINAYVLQEHLQRHHDCVHADCEQAVMQSLQHREFDIVLMDVNLGRHSVDGVELMKRLRREPRFQHMKIFAVTGYAMYDDEAYFLREGFDRYIAKPIDFRGLLQLINQTGAELRAGFDSSS